MKSFKDSLTYQMLMPPYGQYVIDKLKKPLMEGLITLANPKKGIRKILDFLPLLWAVWTIARVVNKYPEPTRENCEQPNTILLLDARDRFFECSINPFRNPLFRAIWRIFIVIYEHDKFYRERINWVVQWIFGSGWNYFELPLTHWKE